MQQHAAYMFICIIKHTCSTCSMHMMHNILRCCLALKPLVSQRLPLHRNLKEAVRLIIMEKGPIPKSLYDIIIRIIFILLST